MSEEGLLLTEQNEAYQMMIDAVAKEVSRSNPSCGIMQECWTKCGTCGADRIIGLKSPDGRYEVAILDNEAELPRNPYRDSFEKTIGYRDAQQAMLSQGWVKKVARR